MYGDCREKRHSRETPKNVIDTHPRYVEFFPPNARNS